MCSTYVSVTLEMCRDITLECCVPHDVALECRVSRAYYMPDACAGSDRERMVYIVLHGIIIGPWTVIACFHMDVSIHVKALI